MPSPRRWSDYDREMALVLAEPTVPGKAEVFGVARITADPDNERAEYAIIVRHDMTGKAHRLRPEARHRRGLRRHAARERPHAADVLEARVHPDPASGGAA